MPGVTSTIHCYVIDTHNGMQARYFSFSFSLALKNVDIAIEQLVQNGTLLTLAHHKLKLCKQHLFSRDDVTALDDILMRLLAGRILADESHVVSADGIELGGPENFHAWHP
jgi:hypothetical protein